MAGTVHTEAYRLVLAELVRARNEVGISQAQLARLLGKPPSFVGKFELGERRLDVIELIVILKALGVAPTTFVSMISAGAPNRLG